MNEPKLAIVLPCYNEEEVLNITSKKLLEVLNNLIEKKKAHETSFVCFVDDGSIDKTWAIVKDLCSSSDKIKGLKLSRNYGHQNALLAGVLDVKDKSDCIVTLDADLQDDVSAIEEMLKRYYDGYDIVYDVRKDRDVAIKSGND